MKTSLLAALVLVPMAIYAADTVDSVKNGQVDTSVPDSPAFAALGLTPQTTTRPASPRSLATTLLNGVDQNGNFQSGLAIDTAPYLLFHGNMLTLKAYQASPALRFLSRIGTSLATSKGTSDADKSSRIAFGVHLTLFNVRDPRMDSKLIGCLTNNASVALQNAPAVKPGEDPSKAEGDLQTSVDAARTKVCKSSIAQGSWNGTAGMIGFAPTWTSTTGLSKDLQYSGGAAWASFGYGFEKAPGWWKNHAGLVLSARYRNKDRVPDPANKGSFYIQDSTLVGLTLHLGTSDTHASIEGVYLHTRPVGRPVDNYARVSFGAEHHLADSLWLSGSVGVETSRANGQNYAVALTGLKWALGTQQIK